MVSSYTLQEAIEGSIKGQIAIQHNAELGVVKAFNAATAGNGPTADIEMSTLYRRRVEGISETYSPPMLGKVPVLYSRLTFPLAVGDEVLVICIDRGVDTAYENGGTGNEPDGTRQNSLSDAFCIPFAWSKATSAALTHTAATVVLDQGAQTAIHIGNSPGVLDNAARQGDNVSPLTPWATWFAAVGTASGAGAPPASTMATITSGSSKVKIE
jgi:hypothetical protein|tara:strand:+ start:243 stop:881 length:639 start_codon:yes stop_codon:yes gene_type:complete